MIIIPILALFGLSSLFSNYIKTKFIFALPVITSLIVIVLYFSTMIKILPETTYVLYCLGILVIKNFNFWQNIKFYQNEIISLTVIILIFFLYSKGAYLHAYDDFCHWGVFSKELLYRGFFENQNSLSSIIPTHAHYPRGPAIYHYFMLSFSGYSEGNVLFAHFLLHLIFLSPLMGNKKFWQTLFFISVMLSVVVLYTTGLRSIYNDSTIGLMFGSIFAIYILAEDRKKALCLVIPIAVMLSLFREVGVWLATIAGVIIILHHCFYYLQTQRNSNSYLVYFMLLALPILSSFIWMDYFKNTHDFFGRKEHSFNNLVFIIENFSNAYKLLLINYAKFLLKFFIKEGSIALYIMIGLGLYGAQKYNINLHKDLKYFLIATFIGYIIFSLWRLYLYFFTFTYDEAIRGASLLRYLGCYALGFGIIACTYIKQTLFLNNQYSKQEIFIIAILFVISSFSVIKNILRIKQLSNEQKVFNEQSIRVADLLKQTKNVNFNFSNKDDDLRCFMLNYALAPYLSNKTLRECMKFPKNISINNDQINKKGGVIYSPFLNKFFE